MGGMLSASASPLVWSWLRGALNRCTGRAWKPLMPHPPDPGHPPGWGAREALLTLLPGGVTSL